MTNQIWHKQLFKKEPPNSYDMLDKRFWNKVIKTDTCWEWQAATSKNGYGQYHYEGRQEGAHRVAYKELKNKNLDKLQIDHLCRNRICVNPEHLEAVTCKENILRGTSFSASNAKKTHCARGHSYSKENTYIDSNGWRQCKICSLARNREWYHRQKMRESN